MRNSQQPSIESKIDLLGSLVRRQSDFREDKYNRLLNNLKRGSSRNDLFHQ